MGHWLWHNATTLITITTFVCGFLLWTWRQQRKARKWMQENVSEPLALVKKMTTENGGLNDPATILDKLHIVEKRQDLTDTSIHELIDATNQQWAEHRAWSDQIMNQQANELRDIWAALGKRKVMPWLRR